MIIYFFATKYSSMSFIIYKVSYYKLYLLCVFLSDDFVCNYDAKYRDKKNNENIRDIV